VTTNSPVRETVSKEEKEQEDALRSPIRFGVTQESDANKEPTRGKDDKTISQNSVFEIMADGLTENPKGNDIYLNAALEKPKSPYEVMQGTIIPGVMITGISSDLPGQILGQVSQNVYDSVTGKYLLIPQGTRIIGSYDSRIMYGQERLLVAWNRLIFPNGYSLSLQGMQGVDISGYIGMKDKVDNHSGKMFTSVILGSAIIAAAEIATKNKVENSWQASAGRGVSENAIQTVDKIIEKNLSIQPTLEIRPGFRFNIFVTKDIILQPYGEY
jgi:type IV secretion system protein VirB10